MVHHFVPLRRLKERGIRLRRGDLGHRKNLPPDLRCLYYRTQIETQLRAEAILPHRRHGHVVSEHARIQSRRVLVLVDRQPREILRAEIFMGARPLVLLFVVLERPPI